MKRFKTETNLGARLGDGTEVVYHVSFGHTDTSIPELEDFVLFFRRDTNVEFLLSLELGWIR